MITVEDRIRYAIARIRNAIYYRLEVEENNKERYRCQYMHVLRGYRKLLLELVGDMDLSDPRIKLFEGMIEIIDPKVKSDECLSTIEDLKWYLIDNNIELV